MMQRLCNRTRDLFYDSLTVFIDCYFKEKKLEEKCVVNRNFVI